MKETEILKRLFSEEVITISAVDGSKTIFNSEDIFKSWIDSDFEDWGLNKPDKKTLEIKTQVHEMTENANFKQMFGSLNDDLDKLCLTQHQIAEFCAKNQKYLRKDDWATFFLFKRRKWRQLRSRYFVAVVRVDAGGLHVRVDRFGYGNVWSADYRHRLVVPQLLVA